MSRALGVLVTIALPESAQVIGDLASGHPDNGVSNEATESRDRLAKRGVK